MKKMKNNLDEMQEKKMLHVEKNCFWGLYWMLFAAMFLQIFTGGSIREIAGEAVCFFTISLFLVFQCLRKGIWDRRLKADPAVYILDEPTLGLDILSADAIIRFMRSQ